MNDLDYTQTELAEPAETLETQEVSLAVPEVQEIFVDFPDGTKLEFKKQMRRLIETDGEIKIYFRDGSMQRAVVDALSDEVKKAALYQGLLTTLGNSTNNAKSVEAAKEAIADRLDVLTSGVWTKAPKQASNAVSDETLAEILTKELGGNIEDRLAAVEAMSSENRKKILQHPRVKAALSVAPDLSSLL